MHFGKSIALIVFTLLIFGSVAAVDPAPGIPHQFYGYVTINGVPADGAGIVAKVLNIYGNEKMSASTTSLNGNYGVNPNIFYVPDPNSDFAGDTIDFFLNGTKVASYVFENGATTRLDLYIGAAPSCGDDICNGGETPATCSEDCGTGSVCGDDTCDTDEDCSSCSEDCGACAPYCGDGSCNGSETCETCSADCGSCGGGAPPGGGGPSGGGGSPVLKVDIEGRCINAPVVVTVLNTFGNPSRDASILVRKDNKTVAEAKSDENGKASFTFTEEADYTFYVTKGGYSQTTKTISLAECVAGEEPGEEPGAQGEEGANLCANVDCDDGNPCTTEYCLNATGHCAYQNQVNGIACSEKGKCQAGICTEPEPENGPVGPGLGLFGLSLPQGAGAGLVILALMAALAYLYALGKKKNKK